jgi:hypothetical protein
VGEPPQRGESAQQRGRQAGNEHDDHRDRHRDGGGEREPWEEQVDERDRRYQQHRIEHDSGRPAIQRFIVIRLGFQITLLALREE